MPSTPSTSLRLELMGAGEQAGTWGSTTNVNLGTLIEGAIAGYTAVTVNSAAQALAAYNYAADEARMAIVKLNTGTVSVAFTIYTPPVTKAYAIWNNTAYTATVSNATGNNSTTATGGATVSILSGEKAYVFSDGTNFYSISPVTLSLSLGTAALPSLSFIGDANTGIYSSGADQVSVALNGSQAANFSPSGLDLTVIDTQGRLVLANIDASTSGPYFQLKKAKGTGGTPAIVQSGDELGTLYFYGYDGANYQIGAKIVASVDTNPGVTDMPGRVSIYTTPDGSGTPAERMRIDNAGATTFYGAVTATSYTASGTTGGAPVPVGSLLMWPTATPPTGWLLCDGSLYTVAAYGALYGVLGVTYGGVAGTNFNVPDFRDRMPIGAGSTYSNTSTGGSTTTTIALANLPAHDHSITDPGHTHLIERGANFNLPYPGVFQPTNIPLGASDPTQSAFTGITQTNSTQGNGSAFSNSAMTTVSPYRGIYFIIKA